MHFTKVKELLRSPSLGGHLCTLAISVGYGATWRLPREAFRHGGLAYALVLTAALVAVALPLALLQLALGQLSQQDTVGIWRAVPFFKGIGYIKLIVAFLSAAITVIYLSLSIAYLLYSARNAIPFPGCVDLMSIEDVVELPVTFEIPQNASECISNTFLSEIGESPEYFIGIAFVIVVVWISTPFIFYKPVKWMKRIFYILGPVTILIGIIILSYVGNVDNLSTFVSQSDFGNLLEPSLWQSAVVQALWSCQIAGGYLISAGDGIYTSMNVQWTALAVVGANIISSWFWLVFWYAIGGTNDKDSSIVAALLQTYQVTVEENLPLAWPLIVFVMLFLSGTIGLIAILYPLYDFVRHIGGVKWRLGTFVSAVFGALGSMALLAGGAPALRSVDDTAVPLLVSVAAALEILALGFIYGWKTLMEDVQFVTESESLSKYWLWGWWLSPALLVSVAAWWVADLFVLGSLSGDAITVTAAAAVVLVVLLVCASVAVVRQVQYDFISKLKSSFQPSRHWGPRDPITHYYWLAARDGFPLENLPRSRYARRHLGQLSARPSFLTVSETVQTKDASVSPDLKKRSNSDDWVYTSGRKETLAQMFSYAAHEKRRSKSLDGDMIVKMKSLGTSELGLDKFVVTR